MTGLIPDEHRIIEIATRVTESDLNLRAEGPVMDVHQSAHELARMDAGDVRQHGPSGRTARVPASTFGEADAEALEIGFLIAAPGIEHRRINLVVDQPVQDALDGAGGAAPRTTLAAASTDADQKACSAPSELPGSLHSAA